MTVVDRTPKPCLHPVARHQHGTRNAYSLDRCRCLPCSYAMSLYEEERRKRNAYGRANYIDAEPARRHVLALMDAGIGPKTIAARAGISHGSISKLIYGSYGTRQCDSRIPSRRITRANAAKILALDPADRTLLARGARTDGVGAARRLQALACIGWSVNRLVTETGVDRQALYTALHGDPVTARTLHAICAAYERLWATAPSTGSRLDRGGVVRTINRARAAGWVPPLAWDEDTIDDPAAAPALGDSVEDQVDELAVALVLEGEQLQLTGATLHAAVRALADAGHQPGEIAARLGIVDRQVYRLRDRITPPRPKRMSAAA